MATTAGHQGAIPISFGAEQLTAGALARQRAAGHEALALNHWLLAVIERPGVAGVSAVGIDLPALAARAKEQLAVGVAGPPLSRDAVYALARLRAASLGHAVVTTEDVSAAVLAEAGTMPAQPAGQAAAPEAHPGGGPAFRATQPTPTLDQYGRDLTREALDGKLPVLVGREAELALVEEIVCRRTKRNPALVGPAGSGKTAIVEGLAQRIVAGEVPEVLRGVRIVALQPSSLTAGAGVVGELETRMKAVLAEASQDGIILFIDELHSMVGSGGRAGVSDVGGLIKPSLARGDLSVIGATTDDEYRQFIEPDKALERRFNRVRVQELSPEQTRLVMAAHRDALERLRNVQVPDLVLDWLLDFASQYLRNRSFPDKGVDLLEQCVAHAVVKGETGVTVDDARAVAERMIGMPASLGDRLERLEDRLADEGLLLADDTADLVDRLQVTMQGLDVRPQRPSAVLLLMGSAASAADTTSRAIAEELFGGPDRIVELDLGHMNDTEDLNTLVGPPPGYIGFEERRPLHALTQMPWSVLLCRNVDSCHPEIANVLVQALGDGVLTERSGRRIYLSDAVVVLTARSPGGAARGIGFAPPPAAGDARVEIGAERLRGAAARALGSDLVGQVDVVAATLPEAGTGAASWVERRLLAGLGERYRQRGLELGWDDTVVAWILDLRSKLESRTDLVREVEGALGSVLIPLLPGAGEQVCRVVVSARDGRLAASTSAGTEAGHP